MFYFMYLSTVPQRQPLMFYCQQLVETFKIQKAFFNYIFKKLNFLLASIHKIYGPFAFLYPA